MKIATAETRCVVKSCEQKYLALSAFHALVKYTEFAQSYSYASKSCRSDSLCLACLPLTDFDVRVADESYGARIEYKCPTAYIQLDMMTTTNLELVASKTLLVVTTSCLVQRLSPRAPNDVHF